MNKKTNEATIEKTEVALVKLSLDNTEELLNAVNSMRPSEIDMVGEYYDFSIGEVLRIIPVGITRLRKKGSDDEWVNAIRFLNAEDGLYYISGAAVLTSALNELATSGEVCPVEVSCTGEKKSAKGTYQSFSIKRLH